MSRPREGKKRGKKRRRKLTLPHHFPLSITMADEKNIIILGASYAGLSVAHYLLKHIMRKLPVKESLKVVLINTSSQVFCRPACPRAMIADDMFHQEKLFVDIKSQFAQYRVYDFRFIQGKTTELDYQARSVTLLTNSGSVETISFHAVVIATGASTPSPLLSLNKDVEFLHHCWESFRTALSTAKHIVIAGGGPAGIETAGELGEYLNGRAGFFDSRLSDPNVAITVVTRGGKILPALRPSITRKAEVLLAKLGVTVVKNSCVRSVEPEGAGTDASLLTAKTTVHLEDGTSLQADIYIPATGTTPNTDFITDRFLLAPDGRVNTNTSSLRVDAAGRGARVYAIGDASTFARPAVHSILSAVPVLCANMRRDLLRAAGESLASLGEDQVFQEDKRETQMVALGQGKGVGAAMGYQLPSFLVWLVKGRDYWLWTTGDLWSGKKWDKERRERAKRRERTRAPRTTWFDRHSGI